MRAFFGALFRFFLTGVATLLPFVVTVFVVTWTVRMADAYIGPSSYFGLLITKIAGPGHALAGYVFGYLIVTILLIFLGFLVNRATVAKIHHAIDAMFAKIPLFGKIHTAVGQLVDLFGKKEQSGLERFGGVGYIRLGNVKMLGLLSVKSEFQMGENKYYLVFVPNSPIPATGFNVFVKVEDFVPADMPVEEMAKLLMSLGVLSTQIIKQKIPHNGTVLMQDAKDQS